MRAWEPQLVLPVAARGGPAAPGLAGHRHRPPRHGLLAAHRHPASPCPAGRRPGFPHRRPRPDRAGQEWPHHLRRPRLGWAHLPGLGAAPRRPAGWGRAVQHRRPPARLCERTDRHPGDPPARHAARDHLEDQDLHPCRVVPVPPGPAPGGAGRLLRAVLRGGPPRGHRGLRRRHPPGSRRRERGAPGRHRQRAGRTGRCPGAAALGAAGPGVLRSLPARPDRAAAPCRRPSLRGLESLRPRGRTHVRRRRRHVGPHPQPRGSSALLWPRRSRTPPGLPTPAGRCGRGSANGRPIRRPARPPPSPSWDLPGSRPR